MSQRREAEIVVIGAGIWGLSVAYHLGSLGFGEEVLVLDRNTSVSDHVSPQAVGAIRSLQPTSMLVRAASYTRDFFENFAAQTNHSAGFVRTGAIYAAEEETVSLELDNMAATAMHAGVELEPVSSEQAKRLAPNFCFERARSIYWAPKDGYVHLPTAGAGLAAASVDLGVRFATGAEALSLHIEDRRIRAVQTSTRTVETSKVIITAGLWDSPLTRSLGLTVPGARKRRRALLTAPIGLDKNHPVVHLRDRQMVVRAERGGYLSNTHESDEWEDNLENPNEAIRDTLRCYLPMFATLAIVEQCGLPTISVKGGLLVGPTPGARGLWIASSSGDSCITFAGAVGRWLARSAVQGHPGDDISAYCLEAQECLAE